MARTRDSCRPPHRRSFDREAAAPSAEPGESYKAQRTGLNQSRTTSPRLARSCQAPARRRRAWPERLQDGVIGQRLGVVEAGVLRAAVGVVNELDVGAGAGHPECHSQRVKDRKAAARPRLTSAACRPGGTLPVLNWSSTLEPRAGRSADPRWRNPLSSSDFELVPEQRLERRGANAFPRATLRAIDPTSRKPYGMWRNERWE